MLVGQRLGRDDLGGASLRARQLIIEGVVAAMGIGVRLAVGWRRLCSGRWLRNLTAATPEPEGVTWPRALGPFGGLSSQRVVLITWPRALARSAA